MKLYVISTILMAAAPALVHASDDNSNFGQLPGNANFTITCQRGLWHPGGPTSELDFYNQKYDAFCENDVHCQSMMILGPPQTAPTLPARPAPGQPEPTHGLLAGGRAKLSSGSHALLAHKSWC
ncbi:hypothetical protein E4U43_002349 [Claviceps pusilla]|uniref:Uncharacterized protein n=1 Tax=Claviceps pusilla TaxID=123648 RepID=A0A9P7N778_9HYPO|nr:hypothetical protein E4U43_002349 [Claviceps pusilla]